MLAVVCLLAPGVRAQGGLPSATITPWRTAGGAVYTFPGATVTVCSATAIVNVSTGTCAPAENDANCCFTSAALTTHIPANPFTADGNGNITPFYAAPGQYQISMTGNGVVGTTFPVTVAGTGGGNVVSSGSYSWPGAQTFTVVNGVIYAGGATYPCTAAGLNGALTAFPTPGDYLHAEEIGRAHV